MSSQRGYLGQVNIATCFCCRRQTDLGRLEEYNTEPAGQTALSFQLCGLQNLVTSCTLHCSCFPFHPVFQCKRETIGERERSVGVEDGVGRGVFNTSQE